MLMLMCLWGSAGATDNKGVKRIPLPLGTCLVIRVAVSAWLSLSSLEVPSCGQTIPHRHTILSSTHSCVQGPSLHLGRSLSEIYSTATLNQQERILDPLTFSLAK